MTNMNCCGQALRRTAPAHTTSKTDLVLSKPPKINGWTWPPQIFQVIGWLVYIYLAVVGFGIYIPLLPPPWSYAAYGLDGVAFLVHLVTHVAAVTIDPVDPGVKAKQRYSTPMPLFDRTKQSHVIENLHCYLCDVKVGPKAKHCGVCNKCVADFDHHCKWLNTCVGGQNYWFFFVAVLSAALGVFLLLMVILFIFIQHFLDPLSLRTAPQFDSLRSNGTWLVFLPVAPIQTSSVALLAVAFITVVLGVTCLLLLTHLLGFHFYLLYKGISTYDYVKIQRQKEARRREIQAGLPKLPDPNDIEAQNQKISVNHETTLPHGSSACTYDDKGQLAGHIADSICTEMENLKKSTDSESSFHYGTETPSNIRPGEIAMSGSMQWRLGAEGGSKGQTEQTSVKSAEGVPQVQNPLGSSIMSPMTDALH